MFECILFNDLISFQVVSEMQKTETKNSKAKDIFEKVKTDVRLMKEELTTIERNQVHCLALFWIYSRRNFLLWPIRLKNLTSISENKQYTVSGILKMF